MSRVKVYSTGVCPFCDKAKMLLRKWQIPFEEIRIDVDQAARRTELHMEDKLDHLVQA
jgi:glutaredoxin 3